jgi:hypothetical protein
MCLHRAVQVQFDINIIYRTDRRQRDNALLSNVRLGVFFVRMSLFFFFSSPPYVRVYVMSTRTCHMLMLLR